MVTALAKDMPVVTPPQKPLPSPKDRQLLAALPSAVGCARRFVRFTLERWRVLVLADAAEAIAAELVGNAVLDSGITVQHPSYADLYDKHLNLVDLRLHLACAQIVIQVWDANPTRSETADQNQAGSRNVYLPPQGGKVVWVALKVPREVLLDGTRALALPRRADYPRVPVPPSPTGPVAAMTDPIMLERVRDGLARLEIDRPPNEQPTSPESSREEW